jgi:hypothetical protein
MEALLALIVLWLSANFGLSASHQHPEVVFAPPQAMADLHYEMLVATSDGNYPPSPAHALQERACEIVAFYVDETRTIHLPDTWAVADPADLSVLLHEMVHHLQHADGLTHACAAEREKLAFAAQERWLRMFGSDLSEAFDIDGLTLLARTTCTY